MSAHISILENLRRSGRRVTPQRMMILETMQTTGGHLTAEEIYQQIQPKHPYMNRSTIYRTLEMLSKEGVVTATDLGKGSVYYELHGNEPHHHMVCQRCGNVAEVDHSLLEPLQDALRRKYKFHANIEHFAIFGLCAKCQEKAEKSRAKS